MKPQSNENDLIRLVNLLAEHGYEVVAAESGYPAEPLCVRVFPPSPPKETGK